MADPALEGKHRFDWTALQSGQQGAAPPPPTTWRDAGVMVGSPPPVERRVTPANWRDYPYSLWALQNARSIIPSIDVPRGAGQVSPLGRRDVDLDHLTFGTHAGQVRLADFNRALYTDAMLVMHRGDLIYERYFNGQQGNTPHLLFSATKSIVGLLAELLVHERILDFGAKVARYVPELSTSGYGDATIEELMDMTVALDYSRTDPTVSGAADRLATQAEYEVALGFSPAPIGYRGPTSTLDALPLIGKCRAGTPHGFGFSYETPNTDALAWVLKRASGQSLSMLLSTRLWSRLGMEDSAYFLCDKAGNELAALGLNAAPRDVLRLMAVLANGGVWGEQEIIAPAVITKLFSGGDKKKFASRAISPQRLGYAYRGQWWIPSHPDQAIQAIGFFGQRLYVNKKMGLVIVRMSSAPLSNESVEADHRALFAAIENHLR